MNAWAWILANGLKLAVIGIIAFLGFTQIQSCRDKGDSTKAAVMAERIRQDSIKAVSDSIALVETQKRLDVALANGVKVVDRWHESAPRPIPVGTPHDSITHLTQQVRACRDAGDSLVASAVEIRTSCTAYRDTAKKTIADLKTGIAHRDSLLEIGHQEKRVQPYVGALYDFVNTRPVFRLGTTVKALGSVHGWAEGEYAIPSAKKPNSGDGFRGLGGLRVNF